MDAGVPLTRPSRGHRYGPYPRGMSAIAVLSDILGDEDHLGDMDFKVAGTETGVTSLQMDIKIAGITEEIMRHCARSGEGGALPYSRRNGQGDFDNPDAKKWANMRRSIKSMQIATVDKIRDVIGSGGKVIRRNRGRKPAPRWTSMMTVVIKIAATGPKRPSMPRAMTGSTAITAEPEVGEIYDGKVVKTVDFGAFVNFFGARDGLVHISQLTMMAGRKKPPMSSRKATRSGSSFSALTIAARCVFP